MLNLKKSIAVIIATLLTVALLFGCTIGDTPSSTDEPDATNNPETDSYADLTTEYVFKVGDVPVYESEFYYFLYQGIRQVYYEADGIYDENASDEDNLKAMIAYFGTTAGDGETYLKKAVDITKKSAIGFKIAYLLGKAAEASDEKYKITEDTISQMEEYIDSEAEYGAYIYSCTADEYFFYQYGMKVNDLKRYSLQQLYAEMSETAWAEANGWAFDGVAPTAPDALSEDATEEQKAEYNTKKAEYDLELEAYNAKRQVYFEKFRTAYEENKNTYDIKTIRYLYLKKAEGADAKADKYIGYFEDGESFEALVKGFSESETAATDLGLVDIDVNGTEDIDIDYEVIEWALAETKLSTELKKIETEDGIYLIKIEGITTFDETTGFTSDEEITNETVKENVEYVHLATLYNAYIEEFMDDEAYKVTEENYDRMLELANEYLNYSASEE